MDHTRVIPRDFFNEAKLLKCYGVLALAIHKGTVPDGIQIEISESGEPFDIVLAEAYGLTVINYPVTVNDEETFFFTTYNSKDPYPFYCLKDGDIVEVFNEVGEFSKDFTKAFAS